MKKVILILSFIVTLTGCGKNTAIQYQKITAQEASEMMSEEVIILDVRTNEEFLTGHIKNAILIPDYELEDKAAEVLPDLNQTILIYCRSGRRSALAAKTLLKMGYTNVFDFGGIETDWNGEVVK